MLMPALANVLAKFFRAADADEQTRTGRASCEKILSEMELQSLAGEEPETEMRLEEESMDVGSDANAEVGGEEWSDDETQRDAGAEDEARNADAVDEGGLSGGTMSEIAVNMNARDAGTQDAGTQDAGTQDAGTQDTGTQELPTGLFTRTLVNF
jgi:(p)ppGpp synthase/HD superfamily hydrolase